MALKILSDPNGFYNKKKKEIAIQPARPIQIARPTQTRNDFGLNTKGLTILSNRGQATTNRSPSLDYTAPRSTIDQIRNPVLGAAASQIKRGFTGIGSMYGNLLQDPIGGIMTLRNGLDPVKQGQRLGRELTGQKRLTIDQATAKIASKASEKVVPLKIKKAGESIEDRSIKIERALEDSIQESRFRTNPVAGENSVITNLSSGVGSLGASLALSRLPGGSATASTLFGTGAAGEQIRQSREAGATNSEALGFGLQAGLAEAGLEKVGLDKFLGNLGADKVLINTAKNSLSEGVQETLQSLAQSGVTAQYQNVDWNTAISSAFQEGLYGALIGGGTTSIAGVSQKLVENGVPVQEAKAIAQNIINDEGGFINIFATAESRQLRKTSKLLQKQWDNASTSQRKVLNKQIAKVNAEIRKIEQGGYINGRNGQIEGESSQANNSIAIESSPGNTDSQTDSPQGIPIVRDASSTAGQEAGLLRIQEQSQELDSQIAQELSQGLDSQLQSTLRSKVEQLSPDQKYRIAEALESQSIQPQTQTDQIKEKIVSELLGESAVPQNANSQQIRIQSPQAESVPVAQSLNTPQPQGANSIAQAGQGNIQIDRQGTARTDQRIQLQPQQSVTIQQEGSQTEQSNIGSQQEKSLESSSSDNTIQLETVNVNDPFNNTSILNRAKNEFNKAVIDEDSEMISLLKAIEKESGNKGMVEQWLFDTNMVRASNSIANSKIERSENLESALRGLSKTELTEFDNYAAARAELSNIGNGLKITSRSESELKSIVSEGNDQFSERFANLNSYYAELSKDLYSAGIIDKQKLDQWNKNTDYVRVQRDMDDLLEQGSGGSKSRSFGSTSTKQKRTGSQREILSPTKVALNRTQQIQLEIQRNKAATNSIDNLVKFGLAKKIPQSQASGNNVIKRFKNGKPEYYATNKEIKRVIDNVAPYQLGVLAQVVAAPTRVFKAGTTALSAPFAATNFARDQVSSAVYSEDAWATHRPDKIVRGLYNATTDYFGGNESALWKEFEKFAGDQTNFDELRNERNSERLIREKREGTKGVLINRVGNPIRTLEDMIGITEKATRFQNFKGIYDKEMKATGNEDVAIRKATQAALQNSVNFSRAGSMGRIANLMFPYFNAGIQGSRNVARSFRDRPVETSYKSVAFVALPTIAAVMYNYEDEERKQIYENIPEFEKQNNFLFVLPGASQAENGRYEGILKIPKPQGYREIVDPIRSYAEKFAGGKDTAGIIEMGRNMLSGMTGPVNTEDGDKFISSFIPQVAKPAYQAYNNKDLYFGSDIVPEYMIEGTDDPTKRAFKGTSGFAKFVGNRLGVSPIKVEKFITDTTGSLGRYGINAVDNAVAISRGDKIGTPENESDYSIGGRSVGNDFVRRVAESSSIEKLNKTPGQQFFSDRSEVTEELGQKQKTAWDAYNQSETNFLGEKIFEANSESKNQARASAYVQFPELFEVDKELDARSRQRGEPGNPFFDLTYEQALQVAQQKALPPGSQDSGLSELYEQSWYENFKDKESKFYDEIFSDSDPDPSNPYDQQGDDVQAAIDNYYDIESSYDKGRVLSSTPWLAQALYDRKEYQNKQRAEIGLPPVPNTYAKYIQGTSEYAERNSGSSSSGSYSSSSDRSSRSGGSRSTSNKKAITIARNALKGNDDTIKIIRQLAESSTSGSSSSTASRKITIDPEKLIKIARSA